MKRILGLDILRTIAIMQVVLVHSTYVLPLGLKNTLLKIIPSIDGVSIFFVLSGFLIGGILLKILEKETFTWKDLRHFWIRRWFRTLPNYFLILVILFAYDIFIHKTESQLTWHYLFFTQNLITNHPDFFPEAWSLSVEEWFYLLYPLTCYLGFKLFNSRRHVFLASALIFLVIPFLLRIIVQEDGQIAEQLIIRKIVVFRLDSLMYGIIGSYLFRYHTGFWNRLKYPGLWIAVFLVLGLQVCDSFLHRDSAFWSVYVFNVEALATLLAIPYFSSLIRIHSHLWERVFTFISLISYSMYVLNLSIVQWRMVPAFLSLTRLKLLESGYIAGLSYFLYWPFLIGSAYLLYRFYEVPMMNLRDRTSKP